MAIAWHKCHEISIHALRGEGDLSFGYEYPTGKMKFLSTPSAGRATRT